MTDEPNNFRDNDHNYRGYVLRWLPRTQKVIIYHRGEGITTAPSMLEAERTVDRWMEAP